MPQNTLPPPLTASEQLDATLSAQGFAVLSSDAGHTAAGGPSFGLDPQARLDYGYQAVGKLTPMAKKLIELAYGKAPDRCRPARRRRPGAHPHQPTAWRGCP